MLVSHRKNFIYTKTMKTAGTSVEAYFERWCLPEGAWVLSHFRDQSVTEAGIVGYRGPDPRGRRWYNHMPAAEIRRGVGERVWLDYFKFCVVRNPFDRMVSAFHFHENAGAAGGGAGGVATAETPVPDPREIVCRFRDWVRAGATVPDLPAYTIDGHLCVDAVLRHERLLEDLEKVCRRLEVPFEAAALPRLKTGFRPAGLATADYYDRETERLVLERFPFDFEQLGYVSPLA